MTEVTRRRALTIGFLMAVPGGGFIRDSVFRKVTDSLTTETEYGGFNFRFNSDLGIRIADADTTSTHAYYSLRVDEGGDNPTEFLIVRVERRGPGEIPDIGEIVQGMWDGQHWEWKLKATPDGRMMAFTYDGCSAILG